MLTALLSLSPPYFLTVPSLPAIFPSAPLCPLFCLFLFCFELVATITASADLRGKAEKQ